MQKRGFIRLVVMLLLLAALSCKKSADTWCIKMISPMGNQVNPIATTFIWSKCNPKDSLYFYLFEYPNNTYPRLISQFPTIGTQYTYPVPLNMGERYAWVLSQKNNHVSDTTYFTTAFIDTLAVGNYYVNVFRSYPCPPDSYYNTCDSSIGYTIVSATLISPGKILFTDNNLTHASFAVQHPATATSINYSNPNSIGYSVRYVDSSTRVLTVTTPNQISVSMDSVAGYDHTTYTWRGAKIY